MISQNALQSFQEEMGNVLNDPYKVNQLEYHWLVEFDAICTVYMYFTCLSFLFLSFTGCDETK